jgi:hypothetical protein
MGKELKIESVQNKIDEHKQNDTSDLDKMINEIFYNINKQDTRIKEVLRKNGVSM